jgi:hypothetical protein
VLVVIDGANALAAGARAVFDQPLIQRCRECQAFCVRDAFRNPVLPRPRPAESPRS